MARVTLRVLDGLERGQVFANLPTPVTIGREEDNDIQLNDERVSRFHAKIQDDGGQVILTDLDSTNGTRVNGHAVHIKVLQPGDIVTIGRCMLLYGDLADWHATHASQEDQIPTTLTAHQADAEGLLVNDEDIDFLSPPAGTVLEEEQLLFPRGAPALPEDLRPLHRAQLSDLLAYLHEQLGRVLKEALEDKTQGPQSRVMSLSPDGWQRLTALQATLASYLHQIANPD